MSKTTDMLYAVIDRRLDVLGTSWPFLEAEDLPMLRNSIKELKAMHELELHAAKVLYESEK